jgi:hypothetical protein
MFSVGDPRDPQQTDPRFASRIEAEHFAREHSFPNIVLAVWHDSSGEVVALAFDGLIFWP